MNSQYESAIKLFELLRIKLEADYRAGLEELRDADISHQTREDAFAGFAVEYAREKASIDFALTELRRAGGSNV